MTLQPTALNLGANKPTVDAKQAETTQTTQTKETASNVDLPSYTSHPLLNYKAGPYKFVNGTFTPKSAEEHESFTKMLETMPTIERNRIRKLDVSLAEQIVQARLSQGSQATQQFDSSIGERGPTKDQATGAGSLNQVLAKQQAAEKPE